MTTIERSPAALATRHRAIGPGTAAVVVSIGAGLIGLTAGQSGIVVIAALMAALGAVAIALRPDRATLVVVAILYSNAAAIAVQKYGVPFFVGATFPLLLVIPFAQHVIIRREPVVVTNGLRFMFGYFFVLVLGTLFGMSADPTRALDSFVTFIVEGLLIYVVVTNVVRSLADLRRIVWVLLLVGGVIGALSVYQQATETYGNDYLGFAQVSQASLDTGGAGQPRLAGMIGEKNRYAQVMVVLIPLGLFRIWEERRLVLKAAAAMATTFIAFGAALTFSRGAALGFAIMIGLMVVMRYLKPTQLIGIVLGVALMLAVQPTYAERLLTLDALGGATGEKGASQAEDASIRKRANETIAALLVFADHPILGVGRGLFPVYYQDYGAEVGIANENDARQAHNLYAGIAAETGILGFVAFFGIFLVTLRDLDVVRRRWRALAPAYANMAIAFVLAIVLYLATGLFLHLAYERFLWLLLALAGATAYIGLQPHDPSEGSATDATVPAEPNAQRADPRD